MPGGIRFEHLPDIAILTHPERLKQMQPLGNFVWETLRDKQNEASDFNIECLFLCCNVFSPNSHHILPRTGENRQPFRSARITPGSRFLTTPTPHF